jgi:hypothetical protein
MRVACLHTLGSNIAVFEAARPAGAEVTLRHEVRADLLEAERSGSLTDEIAARTGEALRALAADADAVLLTCSTLGPAVAGLADAGVPVLRVDAALASGAVRGGGRVVALCTAATTLGPTRALFENAAAGTGATVELRLVPGAWDAFKAGRTAEYHAMIAAAADEAFRDGADKVALAQASMAGAAALCREEKPLESPTVGLAETVAAALDHARAGV